MKAIFAESSKTVMHIMAVQEWRSGEALSCVVEKQEFSAEVVALRSEKSVQEVMLVIGELANAGHESLLFFGTDAEAEKFLDLLRGQVAKQCAASFKKNDPVRVKCGALGEGCEGRVVRVYEVIGALSEAKMVMVEFKHQHGVSTVQASDLVKIKA